MASQTSDQTASGTDESPSSSSAWRSTTRTARVVSGRWFGVRGPPLRAPDADADVRGDGAEQRSLADLEHKPWAAEDGEPWLAAFPLDIELDDAEQLELSVAPDISDRAAAVPGRRLERASAVARHRKRTGAAGPD